ncbi:DUF4147 domain-containing protein, partial [Roseisolibacter sp. H3M3-2]|uniref:DUF4147 domain-containing protein n=1 Tax=Roseisolibacter sp. H3M3-2 TaxID=3031323 RepID=UPI0023DA5D30
MSRDPVADARAIVDAAVAGAMPGPLLARVVARVGVDGLAPRPLAAYRAVVVVGAGKAALATAGAVEALLADGGARLAGGAVTVPAGYAGRVPPGVRA